MLNPPGPLADLASAILSQTYVIQLKNELIGNRERKIYD
jgi:hypothetical protein